MKKAFKFIVKALLVLLLILIAGLFFIKWRMDHEITAVTPLAMSTEGVDLSPIVDPDFMPQTLPPTGEAQHPFMARTDQSAMHSGSWESDTHPAKAVSSSDVEVLTRRAGGKAARQCATFTFIKDGHPLILCGGFTNFRLQLLDKDSLELLAKYDLPMRPSTFEAMVKRDTDIIFTDTSGGAYMYLDNQDQAVLADAKQRIRRIKPVQTDGKWKFVESYSRDMTDYVPNDCYHWNNLWPTGECDGITTVMPDYNGLLWWVTRKGRVGSLNTETGEVLATDLNGEEIQNSFALDEDGAYIVSDHAMYHMKLVDGMPTEQWRVPYERGSGRKVGSINQGSGTSPSLFGEDYLTFTDNADDHMNIYVARRGELGEGEERVICKVPVFTKGASVTDNSMIAYGRSIILENNAGYTNSMIQKDYNAVEGGVVRVDVREDESGCDTIWTNPLKVPSVVPKLSLGNGIAYFYSFKLLENGDRLWSLVGLDFETGKEVIRIPTGTGEAFNNNWASIAIAPNGDTWVGTRQGVLKVKEIRYFPNSFDEFRSEWYSSHLKSMDEPSFQKYGEQNLVRFTWLPTFNNPIAVRVETFDWQTGKIILKRTDGFGGYGAGEVVETLEKNLSNKELLEIKESLAMLKNCTPTRLGPGLDGAQWVFETYEEGQHCISDIWSPGTEGRKGQFREFGTNLFKLAGLDIADIKFY